MLEAGNIIQGVTEWSELLEGGYVLITDIDMWMSSSHYANICNKVKGNS